jgi:hypothetical protein
MSCRPRPGAAAPASSSTMLSAHGVPRPAAKPPSCPGFLHARTSTTPRQQSPHLQGRSCWEQPWLNLGKKHQIRRRPSPCRPPGDHCHEIDMGEDHHWPGTPPRPSHAGEPPRQATTTPRIRSGKTSPAPRPPRCPEQAGPPPTPARRKHLLCLSPSARLPHSRAPSPPRAGQPPHEDQGSPTTFGSGEGRHRRGAGQRRQRPGRPGREPPAAARFLPLAPLGGATRGERHLRSNSSP